MLNTTSLDVAAMEKMLAADAKCYADCRTSEAPERWMNSRLSIGRELTHGKMPDMADYSEACQDCCGAYHVTCVGWCQSGNVLMA